MINPYEDDDERVRRLMLEQLSPATGGPTSQPFQGGTVFTPSTYTEGVDRRGGGTGGFLGGAASGAGAGAAAGSILPGLGTGVGAMIGGVGGGIVGAIKKHAPTAPTDFSVQDARGVMSRAYQDVLGRPAGQADFDSQLRGQGWEPGDRWVGESGLNAILASLSGSPEAQARNASPTTGASTPPPAGTTPPTSPTTTAPTSGATGNSAYAPRIVTRNGQTFLQEHGNERPLQGEEIAAAQQYVNDFASQFPTGFQPDVGGGLTSGGAPVGAQTNAGYQQTGWGFDSPTGGRAEFQYTPQGYSGSFENFSGFSPQGEGSSDTSSIKNIFRDAAQGLGEGEGGFTEADVDEVVGRLNAMGINATKVDAYQIDFGNGEGPIQVRSSKNEVWWNNRATEGQVAGSGGGMGTAGGGSGIADMGSGSTLDAIQALIRELTQNGYARDQVLNLLKT